MDEKVDRVCGNKVRSLGPQPDQQDQDLCESQVYDRGISSFIHSFNKYALRIYYMPGTVLDTEDPAVNKMDRVAALILVRLTF